MTIRNAALGIAAAAMTALASPAIALSCMPADIEQSYKAAMESELAYGIFYGSIDIDDVEQPSKDGRPQPYTARGVITAQEIQATGLSESFEHEVIVDVQCMGEWCGSASDVTEVVFFAHIDEQSNVTIEESACPQWVFGNANGEVDRVIGLLTASQAEVPANP